jgi:hypothetical protein
MRAMELMAEPMIEERVPVVRAVRDRIDLISYVASRPAFVCSFFWDLRSGITCTSPTILADFARHGIALSDSLVLRPESGRVFLDALLREFAGSPVRARRVPAGGF